MDKVLPLEYKDADGGGPMKKYLYRFAAMVLLGCVLAGHAEDAKIDKLTAQLKDPDAGIRARAAIALSQVRPPAKDALPGLTAALADNNLNVRYWAATALKKFGPEAVSAVPALIMALKTFPGGKPELEGPVRYFPDVRSVSAEALGAIGPGAKDAIPALEEATKDQNKDAQVAATAALKNIHTDAGKK